MARLQAVRFFVFVLVLAAALLALGACGDDDDDDQDGNDDDTGDDDDTADDDDDSGDDDDDDDDYDNDDDSTPEDPYASMTPTGKILDDILAISSHLSKSENPSTTRDFEIEKLVDASVNMLRTDFSWGRIEPADDDWHFAGYDVMVDQCLADGIQVDALLDYGVGWAMPGGSHDEISPDVWADFTGTVAAHFADRIDLYEIWNEQNTSRFWKPSPNPEHYGNLLKAGYTAVHENDPTATVLFGGLSPADRYMFGPDGVWNFLARVADAHPDVCDYIDGMAIHPYTFFQQTSPEWALDLGLIRFPNLVEGIDLVRSLLDKIGCPQKPLYLTEIGWPDLLIGTERQAAYLPRSLLVAAAKGVEFYFWYTFWDGEGTAFPATEDAFGLFTWPGGDPVAKPVYEALMGLHQIVGALQYAGDLGAALNWAPDRHALVFGDATGQKVMAFWHSAPVLDSEKDVVVPLPAGAQGWTLFDQNGQQIDSGGAASMQVEISLGGRVGYLVFD